MKKKKQNKVDFSKMTPEIYEKIVGLRKSIDDSKKRIALLRLELNSLDDKAFDEIKLSYEKFADSFNFLDELLKPFEI